MPTVSVIIPTYNYGRFIDEALNSVFTQTFQDFEILVIDDGSTDDTPQKIAAYSDRIRYFQQNQKGPAAARNLGIMESRGDYIAFLDADDKWCPTKLEKQLGLFKSNVRLGMALTDNSLFDDAGIYKEYTGKRNYLFSGNLVANIFIHSGVVTPTVMVRRAVFDKVGLFEEKLLIAEDDNMWIRIAVEYEVDIVDESLASIRDHRGRTIRALDKMMESVEENILLLTTQYGRKVADSIIPYAPLKRNQLYFNEGYKHFEAGNYSEARKLFYKAIQNRPGNWRAYSYLAISYVPTWIMKSLKAIKRRLLPTSLNSPKWTRG